MATDNLSMPAPVVQYRDVPGGNRKRYRVGDDGSAWSSGDGGKTWTRINPSPQPSGHMRVFLGKGVCRYIHRLILEAFVGPCPPGLHGLHDDDNPANNRLDNLSYGTPKKNGEDRVRNGRTVKGRPSPRARYSDAQILEVVRLHREGVEQQTIADQFGMTKANVQAIVYGITWSRVTGIEPRQYPAYTKAKKAT